MQRTYDCAIVPTCGMHRYPFGWVSDVHAHLRSAAAAEYYHSGRAGKIILAGGKITGKDNPSLSEKLKPEVHAQYGVELDDILTEDYSVDTTENAEFSLEIARDEGFHSAMVLTSHWHLPRTMMSFRKYGRMFDIEVEGRNAEDVLLETGRDDYAAFVEHYHADIPGWLYMRNKVSHLMIKLPFGEQAHRIWTHRKRDDKEDFDAWLSKEFASPVWRFLFSLGK